MTTKTEAVHAAAFLISYEDEGSYSFEQGVVASGSNLPAGQVLMLNGSNKLVAWDAGTASPIAGILYQPTDASAADTPCTYVARSAEVRLADLTYPAGTDTLLKASLKAINGPIITR